MARTRGRSAPRGHLSRSSCRPAPAKPTSNNGWPQRAASRAMQAQREVLRPPGRAPCSTWWPTASACRAREKVRAIEAIETALKRGSGARGRTLRGIRCRGTEMESVRAGLSKRPICGASPPACTAPTATSAMPIRSPALFSFNSAYGACDTCRGFGRVIGVDYGLVIPDHRKTLRAGAIKPMQTPAWKRMPGRPAEVRRRRPASRATRPGRQLTDEQRDWVINGSPNWKGNWNKQWYGVRRFFLPGIEGLQDAHPRALVQIPQLHALHGLRRRAAEDRSAAVAPGLEGRCRMRCCPRRSASCRGRAVDARAARGAAGADGARPDADPDRRAGGASSTRSRSPAQHARRGAGCCCGRDPHAAQIPVRRRHRLPDAGSPEPHAFRRRGAAHQPDHRRGHSLVNTMFVLDEPSIDCTRAT